MTNDNNNIYYVFQGRLVESNQLIRETANQIRLSYGGPQGQYNNIYSSTKIFTPVQQYLFQYKINHPSTTIFIPVQN